MINRPRQDRLLRAAPRVAIATLLLAAPLPAAVTQDPAASQPERTVLGPLPPEGPLKITVVEFAGKVQYRTSSEGAWTEPKPGEELSEGVEFRTGVKSFIKIAIDNDQVVTLDRLGVTKVNKAAFENGTFKSDVGVKYGRLKYEIEAAGRVHDATVRSATSTLAVRGTVFEIFDQPPFTPQAISYTGAVLVRDARKQIKIGSRGSKKVQVDGDKQTAAETALATAAFDPIIDGARTPAEQRLIEQVIGQGGIVSTDVPGGIPVVRGGTPLQFNETNSASLPGGGLNFVLNWTGNADLNLTVALPALNEFTTPVTGFNRSAGGGITAFDHRGGPNGGFEIVFFQPGYPGSDATGQLIADPTGELITDVIDPSIVRPAVELSGALQGGFDYVFAINLVTGVPDAFSLKTFIKDENTGEFVLVRDQFGTLNGDVTSLGDSSTVRTVFYNAPPANPGTGNRTAQSISTAASIATPHRPRGVPTGLAAQHARRAASLNIATVPNPKKR